MQATLSHPQDCAPRRGQPPLPRSATRRRSIRARDRRPDPPNLDVPGLSRGSGKMLAWARRSFSWRQPVDGLVAASAAALSTRVPGGDHFGLALHAFPGEPPGPRTFSPLRRDRVSSGSCTWAFRRKEVGPRIYELGIHKFWRQAAAEVKLVTPPVGMRTSTNPHSRGLGVHFDGKNVPFSWAAA